MSGIESVTALNFIWGIVAVPIGYLYTLAIGHRTRLAKVETKVEDLEDLKLKVDTLCENVSYIKGKIDILTKK